MSLTALEWGLRAPITPRFGGNLEALPRPQDTEPKQQQKTDLKHKESDRPHNNPVSVGICSLHKQDAIIKAGHGEFSPATSWRLDFDFSERTACSMVPIDSAKSAKFICSASF
jgi:hypothetical protein